MKFEVPSEGEEKISKKVSERMVLWLHLSSLTVLQYDQILQHMTEKFASVIDE